MSNRKTDFSQISIAERFPAQTWVALDCETTDLLPRARLIELAAVRFETSGQVVDTFSTLVCPPVPVSGFIRRLTGITPDALSQAEPAATVIRKFFLWLPENAVLVAHNAPFDASVIAKEARLSKIGWSTALRWLDSLPIARAAFNIPDYRLSTIALHCGWNQQAATHRASADAHFVRKLLLHALELRIHETRPDLFVPLCLPSN